MSDSYLPPPLSSPSSLTIMSSGASKIASSDLAISKGRKIYGYYESNVKQLSYHRPNRSTSNSTTSHHPRHLPQQLSQPIYTDYHHNHHQQQQQLRRQESAASYYSESNRALPVVASGDIFGPKKSTAAASGYIGSGWMSRGWSRESLLTAPFGQRGKEMRPSSGSGGGSRGRRRYMYSSYQSLHEMADDEPLVPRPTFVSNNKQTTTVLMGNGGGGLVGGEEGAIGIMSTSSDDYRINQQQFDWHQRYLPNAPNGSPYHRLKDFARNGEESLMIQATTRSQRSRPLSVASIDAAGLGGGLGDAGVGEEVGGENEFLDSSYLTWSVDTIVRMLCCSLWLCFVCFLLRFSFICFLIIIFGYKSLYSFQNC